MEQEQKLNPITIKSFTDIEQSRKLEEILPIESADMVYIKHSSSYNPIWEFNEDFPPMILGNVPINKMTVEVLPCWSLAALLELMPVLERKGYQRAKPQLLYNVAINKWIVDSHVYTTDAYGNPVNACYEMIIKLHELNLL